MKRAMLAIAIAIAILWWRWPASETALALVFEPGSEYEYRFSWQQTQRAVLGPDEAAMEGGVHLRGTLIVRAYDGGRLGIRFGALSQAELSVAGERVAAELENEEAILLVTPNGRVNTVYVRPEAPAVFEHAVTAIASELDTHLDVARATAASPFGMAETAYRRTGATITRTRERYRALAISPAQHAAAPTASSSELTLAAAGHWSRVREHETIAAEDVTARLDFTLDLVEVRRGRTLRPPLLTAMHRRTPGEVVVTATGERDALARRVDGLTRADVLAGLAMDTVADANRWFWRASGLVELEPAVAVAIAELVTEGRLGDVSTARALDVLAAAGTPPAQAALRDVLAHPSVRERAGYPLLLQRISLVETPTAETAEFARTQFVQDRSGEAAYTLGAVAHNLERTGHPDLARKANELLRAALARPDPDVSRAHLIGALGNAARIENIPIVLGYAHDDDASVRRAVAAALRQTATREATQALTALFGDPSEHVQHAAVTSLRDHALDARGIAELAARVRRAHATNAHAIIELFSRYMDHAAAKDALRELAALRETLPEERERIMALLGS